MEENPFVFGKAVEGSYFTNRTKDTEHLEANLTHGINTILISPRRWGKTSLVKKVMANIISPDIKIIYIDVFSCKSEYDFYKVFASTIIQQTSSKIEEWMTTAKEFLSRVITKVAFSPDSIQEYSLSFEFPVKDDAEDILQLPERIAQKKGIHIVLCLDEFNQNETIRQFAKVFSINHHRNSSYACLMCWRRSKIPYWRVAVLR